MRAGLLACSLVAACNGGDIVIGAARDLVTDAGDGGGFVPPPCWPCSADLQSIVSCDGKVTPCPLGQACRPFPPDGGPARCEGNPCNAAAENGTSIGCDFFLLEPDVSPPTTPGSNWGACWAALVANVWNEPLAMWFEQGNNPTSYDAASAAYVPTRNGNAIDWGDPLSSSGGFLPAKTMAVVFIAGATGNPACPSTVDPKFGTGDFAFHGTGKRNAIRLRTTLPASVYDVYPFGGAIAGVPSATLALPTSTWGGATLGVTGWPQAYSTAFPGLAIVSLGTTVNITSPVAIVGGGGIAPAPKGFPARYPIAPGELLQLEQFEDLSGALVTQAAGAPFSVWGVHSCMSFLGAGTCDGAHTQLPPAQALGSRHVAARFPSRVAGEEPVPWRIVALAENTQLTFDPPGTQPATVLAAGQSLTFSSAGPFVVSSQNLSHPFYVVEHMTRAAGNPLRGDPEMVGLVPVEQWLTGYTFAVDPTYPDTSIVIVQGRSDSGGFQDVFLDCVKDPQGAQLALPDWTTIDVPGRYRFTRYDLQLGGSPVGGCDFGIHTISSRSPFSLTVWGMDTFASVAYPAGQGLRKINSVNVVTTPK